MTTQKIGFVGLGRMGRPMASNLQRKGFATLCYDVDIGAMYFLSISKGTPRP